MPKRYDTTIPLPSLQEATQRGLKHYQGLPCKKGHSGRRWVAGRRCMECAWLARLEHHKPWHHLHGHPLYITWKNITQRCCNPKATSFPYYGARGITVCDRWRHSFTDFLADVGERPSQNYEIDRIDQDGNYEPGNVQWITKTENRRKSTQAKLTIEKAREIRRLYAEGCKTTLLAIQFGVDRMQIWRVLSERMWKE